MKGKRLDAGFHLPSGQDSENQIRDSDVPSAPLGELCLSIAGGATPHRRDDSQYADSGIKFLRIQNITEQGLNLEDVKFVTPETNDGLLSRSQLQAGDVLMTITGRIGTAAAIKAEDLPGNINQHIALLRLDQTRIVPEFLAAFLNSDLGTTLTNRSVTGTTRLALDYGAIRELPIPVPEKLDTQRALVGELEAARTQRREQLAQADALLAGLDDWLLEQLDLKVPEVKARASFGVKLSDIRNTRMDVAFQTSERSGAPTSRFALKPLGELVDFASGGTPNKATPTFWEGDIPWVSPKDFGPHLLRDSEDHISPAGVKGAGLRLLAKGTVLMVVRSGVLKHTLPVTLTDCEVTINQDLKALLIRPDADISAEYLAVYLSVDGQRLLPSITKHSTTVQSLNTPQLEQLPIPLPPPKTQATIAAEVRRRRDEAARLRAEAQIGWDAAKARFEAQLLGDKTL